MLLCGYFKMKMNKIIRCVTLFVAMLSAITMTAQQEVPKISMITCHAGSDIYELCGHTALRIQYNGFDIAVNYGMFDFDTPNFVYRFVKGETDYKVGAYQFDRFYYSYAKDDRRIVEQELNLTPHQAQKLVELIDINLLPQNRVYRYNYVKDNCATRPLAMVERAIGDTITLSSPMVDGSEQWSFRDEMRYFHKNYPWYQMGIDLCLGSGIDYTISNREKGFAPEILEQLLDKATVIDSTGTAIPLVTKTRILHEGEANGAIEPPTPWYLTPMMVFSLLLGVVSLITCRDIKRKKVTRWVDSVIFGLFGIEGCILTFLIFVSVHEATSPNWLYLWLNPLCFIPAIAVWIKNSRGVLLSYHFVNFVALFLLSILWICGVQIGNIAFIPLILTDAIRSLSYIYINKCAVKTKA